MRTWTFVFGAQIILLLSLITLLSSGCASGVNSTKISQPPQIPPQSTFVMDFSDFTQNASSHLNQTPEVLFVSLIPNSIPPTIAQNALGDYTNWGFAALNAGFWNLQGAIGLAIPVAAFVESIKQIPVKQPDNSWVWTYGITVKGITYTAKLQGKYINTGVHWDMYVSKQNEYTDFLWYYGESNSSNTQGYWVLKQNPSTPNDLLRIDWHRDPANETGDIKYTNTVPGGSDNGGYILLKATQDQSYNRSYVIFNKNKNETTNIEWNSMTKAGRVQDSVHFGNNNWHYWDSSLKNTSNQ